MEYGDADGYGRYGILEETDDGLVCHHCGRVRRFLGRHVRVHELSADDYREAHGLPRSLPLASTDLREQWSEESAARVGSESWARFETARDPDAAREASRAAFAEPARAGVVPGRRERAAAASRSRATGVCTVAGCGRPSVARGWCRSHYGRWQRTGDVQAGVPVREWRKDS
jgi:hypothetical protein